VSDTDPPYRATSTTASVEEESATGTTDLVTRFKTIARRLTEFRRNIVISIVFFLLMIFIVSFVEQRLSLWAKATASELAASANLTFAADDLSVHAFRFMPRVEIQGVELAAVGKEPLLTYADVSIHLSWWDVVTGLTAVKDVRIASLRMSLLVDDHGVDNGKEVVKSLLSLRSNDGPVIQVQRVDIAEGLLEYINDELLHSGTFALDGKWIFDGLVADSGVKLSGSVNSLPVKLSAAANAEMSDNWGGAVAIDGELGELGLQVRAKVGDIDTLADAQLDLDLVGKDLKTVLNRLSLGHTDVSDIAFNVSSHYQSNNAGKADIHLALGRSKAKGQFDIEGLRDTGQNIRIAGTLKAQTIFMDAILGSSSARDSANSAKIKKPQNSTDVFSDTLITDQYALGNVDIDLDVSVNTLHTGSLRISDLLLSLEKNGDDTQLRINSDDFGRGKIEAELSLKTDELGIQGKLYAQAKRVPIGELMSLGDMPDGVASGKLSGDAKFWVSGNSMAELASSLDGGLFILIEEGKLDSLLVEMAGIDLMESISLVMKRDLQQTDIGCGYMDLQADSGLITIKDFIVDTEDSVFVASGKVNLDLETIDLKFSPLPRDASFLAATTPVNIVGTLSSPKIRPGAKLYTRVALAAAMVALAGPATIVLPFIEVGDGDETSYCSEFFGQ